MLFQHTKLIVPGEDSIIEKRYVAKAFNRVCSHLPCVHSTLLCKHTDLGRPWQVFHEELRKAKEEDTDALPTLSFPMFKKMLRRLAKRLGIVPPP